MATWKLAPALAAGCTVVLKPDPQTPLTALRLAELATEVGFPRRRDQRRPGGRARRPARTSSGTRASTRSRSPARRRRAARSCGSAADPIKRLMLELGGKSPNLVFADADLDDAIPSSVWSIYYSAGPELRGALARARRGVDLRRLRRAASPSYAEQLKVGDPLDPETQVGSLISTAHRDRVHGFVERGREEGAEVVAGGEPGDGKGAFYQPTVLAGVDNEMTVAQEEIFGPVVTVDPVRGREGRDPDRERRRGTACWRRSGRATPRAVTASRARSSPGWSGSTCRTPPSPGIPFGGYKQSGFGRELGVETLELYLETKGVLVSTSPKPFNPFGL